MIVTVDNNDQKKEILKITISRKRKKSCKYVFPKDHFLTLYVSQLNFNVESFGSMKVKS